MTISLARLVNGDGAVPPGAEHIAVKGLTSDSRAVKPGFVFAALPGSTVDGSKFIPQAIAAGAVAVVAGEGAEASGAPLVIARNPRQAFAARFAMSRMMPCLLTTTMSMCLSRLAPPCL